MAETRIYVVKNMTIDGLTERLIEATSQAQALRFATKDLFICKIPTTKHVGELMSQGVKIETKEVFDKLKISANESN